MGRELDYINAAANVAQVGIGHHANQIGQAQLAQLRQIHGTLAAQQQALALQANLNQALFDTERVARRVALTLPQDAFAAVVHAHYWLARVEGIRVDAFHDIASKRSWADAIGTLQAAARRRQSDASLAGDFSKYTVLMDEWNVRWLAFGGDEANFRAQQSQRRDVAERHASKRWRQALIWSPILGVVSVLVFVGTYDSRGAGGAFFSLILFIAFLLLWYQAIDARKTARGVAEDVAEAESAIGRFDAFMADPANGGRLREIWGAHPLLFEEPTPDETSVASGSANSVQTYVERRVVERQTVVTRCKFCQQMTPVDAETCQKCGAPGFGG